jgi:hypothetical protein
MNKRRTTGSLFWPLLALTLLAGCATTDPNYSSLPPSAHHPSAGSLPTGVSPPLGPTVAGSTAAAGSALPLLRPDEYADLLDRIRVGYGLNDVQHFAVDREVEAYRSKPDYLDRTFKRGARYLYYIVT